MGGEIFALFFFFVCFFSAYALFCVVRTVIVCLVSFDTVIVCLVSFDMSFFCFVSFRFVSFRFVVFGFLLVLFCCLFTIITGGHSHIYSNQNPRWT